jgi:hypothetical protein
MQCIVIYIQKTINPRIGIIIDMHTNNEKNIHPAPSASVPGGGVFA